MKVYFITHAASIDNEAGIASGWNNPPLSESGLRETEAIRKSLAGISPDLVCCSDLQRATDTAFLVFGEGYPIRLDRRLREVNYGDLNGAPVERVEAVRRQHAAEPFPGGESYAQAAARVHEFLTELQERYPRMTVAVIGHRATRCGLETFTGKKTIEECLAGSFKKQPYWEYGF